MNTGITIPPSARLRYRLMDSSDADLFFELDQDPEVMRFLNEGKPSTREDIDNNLLPHVTAITDPATGCGIWEIRQQDAGAYLGWILVRQYGFGLHYHDPENLELGWRLKRHCWGQGIATEAASAILQVLQQDPSIRSFCAIADQGNLASIGVMKKLGMHFVDHRMHHARNKLFEVVYYEMPSAGLART